MSQSKSGKGNILVIHGQPADPKALIGTLIGGGYVVQSATSGQLALKAVRTSPPDLILLDVGVPDMGGYEICRRLKADERARDIPIIFSSVQGEPQDRAKVFAAGGVDYVAKPFQGEEILARVETHLALRAMQVQLEKKDARLEHEIAERKQAEEQARQQSEFLTRILESLTHPFYVIDANDYTVQIANSAARLGSLSGRAATCHALTHGLSRPCATASHPCPVEEIKGTKKPVTVEHVHYDQDGNARNVEIHAYPLFDSEGNIVQVIEYALDITEGRQAEEALRESEEKWRSLTEYAPDHVMLLDRDANILFINHALFELSPEQVIGTSFYDYALHEYRQAAQECFERVLKTGQPDRFESVYADPNGRRLTFESYVGPVMRSGKVWGLTVRSTDITESKRAQETLQNLTHELGERVKELNCLYGVSRLAGRQDISLEEIFQGTIDLIPPAFQYPEVTCARIIREGQEFRTRNFEETIWRLATDLVVHGEKFGTLEVYYLEGRPEHDERPFLEEERSLIDAIASRLGRIAERMQAEEALRQSEKRYRQLLETLQEGIWVIDKDVCTTFANPRMAEMLGYTVDEMQGKHLFSFMDERGVEICKRNLKRREQGIKEQHDFEFLRKDGSRIYAILETAPIFDDDGTYIGAIAGVQDITGRRRAEEALRESEARWRSVTENSPDHVLILDTDLNIQFVNYASPGLTTQELIGTPLYAYVSEERRSEIKEILENVLKTAEPASYETEYSALDGSTIYYESRVVPRTLDDQVIGLAVNARDITDRRRSEDALQKSETLLRETQRMAKVGGWELDLETHQVVWTEEVYRIHEVTPDFEPNFENALSFYAPEHRLILAQAIQRAAETGQPWDLELQFITAAGNRLWVRAIGKVERQDGRAVKLSGTFQDITERRQTEQALREAKEAAEGARREEGERRQEAERRRQIAESLADVLAALNSNQPLDKVLDYIAAQTGPLLGNQAVAICRLQDEAETLAIEAAKGLPVDCAAGADNPLGHGALRQAMASCHPVVIPDLAAGLSEAGDPAPDAEWPATVASWAKPIRALLAVPIVVKEQVYGGMVLYYAEPRTFSVDEVELAVVFGDQVALAIENARLRDQIEKAAATAERSRLARDLHDSVTQALFSATLVAEVLPQVWRRDPAEAQQGLEELRQLTRGALAEMRTMLLELRPTALVETKLDDLLRQLTEAITSRAQLLVSLNVDSTPTLPPDVHVTFYRVGQEALHNAVKHAEASQVTVDLRTSPPVSPHRAEDWQGQVRLCVSDDGQGFDPGHLGPDQLGLSIMRERAETVGAKLTIESQPGRGTQVTLVWKYTGSNVRQ